MRRRTSAPPISLFSFQDIITSVTGIMILVTLLLALDMLNKAESAPPQKTKDISSELRNKLADTRATIDRLKKDLDSRQKALGEVAGLDPRMLERQLKELEERNGKLQTQIADALRDKKAATDRQELARAEQDRRSSDPQKVEEIHKQAKEVDEQWQKLKQSKRVIFNPAAGTTKRPWLVEISDRKIVVAEVGREEPPQQFSDVDVFDRWAAQRSPTTDYFVLLVQSTGVTLSYAVERTIKDRGFELGVDLLAPGQTAIDPQSGTGLK